jgi:hypothetical protein
MITENTDDTASAMLNRRERKIKPGNPDIRPDQALLERVRDKQAKRKAEEDLIGHKPSKAACEQEERIAEVQLKAFWTCFPLTPGTTDENRQGDAKDPTGHVEAAVPDEPCSKGRKQLLARLRDSIIERDQANKKEGG